MVLSIRPNKSVARIEVGSESFQLILIIAITLWTDARLNER